MVLKSLVDFKTNIDLNITDFDVIFFTKHFQMLSFILNSGKIGYRKISWIIFNKKHIYFSWILRSGLLSQINNNKNTCKLIYCTVRIWNSKWYQYFEKWSLQCFIACLRYRYQEERPALICVNRDASSWPNKYWTKNNYFPINHI